MKLPKQWLSYSRSGVIDSTRFVAFKVPLSQLRFSHLGPSQRFTPEDLIRMYPEIRLVIDLSYSYRFYDKEFESKQIEHVKIMTRGQVVPSNNLFYRFAKVVDDFIRRFPSDGLIGVHCTHGVNRTGYFICRYMIERMGFLPEEAMNIFERCRGHRIKRKNYTNDLLTIKQRIVLDGGEGVGEEEEGEGEGEEEGGRVYSG